MQTQISTREQKTKVNQGVSPLLFEVIPLAVHELRSSLKSVAKNSITVHQFRILVSVQMTPSNMKDLSDAVAMSLPATSRMIKMMGKKGWLEFSKSLTDKREIKIRLSKKGVQLYLSIQFQMFSLLEERLGFLTPEDSFKITEGLSTLKKALNDLRIQEN